MPPRCRAALRGSSALLADFTNTSNQVIVYPVAEVVELTGGNLLLNADGGLVASVLGSDQPRPSSNPEQAALLNF